ncbi:uncharacterized protein BXZ73DRAFT_31024, partial [Epithele typhae]|uniref:uncharacterized protein n=1 Tax=Epithele typhae TaxID=378194 RepID=UPI0020073C6B
EAIPAHWTASYSGSRGSFARSLFHILCAISVGHTSLDRKWVATTAGGDVFARDRESLINRITTLTVVAGLLLTSAAALVTTPPPSPAILDYTARGPCIALWASFGILLGGIIVASADLYVLATCDARFMADVLMATRARVVCSLTLLAYPFFSIGGGALLSVCALLVAAWNSPDPVIRVGCVFLFAVPVTMLLVFVAAA